MKNANTRERILRTRGVAPRRRALRPALLRACRRRGAAVFDASVCGGLSASGEQALALGHRWAKTLLQRVDAARTQGVLER